MIVTTALVILNEGSNFIWSQLYSYFINKHDIFNGYSRIFLGLSRKKNTYPISSNKDPLLFNFETF